jgi:lactate permease
MWSDHISHNDDTAGSMYTPDLQPLGGSLLWSALLAALPLLTVFITLGVLRWRAHWAGLSGLAVALVVAIAAYQMPTHLALLSGTEGFVFGLFPIMWIVINAIWLYELTVASGRFEDLRRVIDGISDDPRIQAIIIAFCFGGLLEALAGFGAPVAITGVMLMAVGFTAMRAAAVVLVANTAPVAFGAIATPIITAGKLTGIDYHRSVRWSVIRRQSWPFLYRCCWC